MQDTCGQKVYKGCIIIIGHYTNITSITLKIL